MLMNFMKMLVKSISGLRFTRICHLRSSPELFVKHSIASSLFCLSCALHLLTMCEFKCFMLSTVKDGCEVKTFNMILVSAGQFPQAIVSNPCFLKCVSSLAHRLSRSLPVLNLCASSVNVPLARFRWVVAAFALLDLI